MSLSRFVVRCVLGKRLPVHRGAIEVAGLDRDATIRRDRHGVPHIRASNDVDAWFALGFCQGQDRAFQLECVLRLARGTMAEIVGEEALPIDRLSRRIDFHGAARRSLAIQREEVRAAVGAYARGVDAGRTRGLAKRPHEFVILRCHPTPYTADDAAAVLPLMSFLLASNWDAELARWRVFLDDGPDAVRALDPSPYRSDFTLTSPPGVVAGAVADRLAADLDALARYVRPGGASNNWVLAGSRTASGRPIVANDPHLAPSLPSPWYLAHIETPEWSAAGASFVGAPGISVGHNGAGAWGVTSGFVDNTDLFVEEVGEDGRSVRSCDGFVECKLRRERIVVKGGGEIFEDILETPHGPVISPAIAGERHALALRAVWLDPLPLCGTLAVQRARSFAEFRECFREWPTLPLNFVWGDTSGAIGWQLAGAAPRRQSGFGTLPVAGWREDAGWHDERVPFESMPSLESPPCGFIATANNAPRHPDAEPFLGADYLDSFRQERIAEALAARTDWDVESTLALQVDVACVPWRRMRARVLAACATRPRLARVVEVLRDWDGVLAVDSSAATVFELLVAELCRALAHAYAPNAGDAALGRGLHPIMPRTLFAARRVGHLLTALEREPPPSLAASWDVAIADAVERCCAALSARFGRDPARWAWGQVRGVHFRHPFGTIKTLSRVFDRGPFAMGGDANTVAQSAVDPLDPLAPALFVPSLRMVVDVGAWDDACFVIPGGQSGNPLSRHYDDQLELWLRGEAIRIAWTPAAVERETRETLVLRAGPA